MLRTALLSQYNTAIVYLGLFFGLLGNIVAASFVTECIVNMQYGDYTIELLIALAIQCMSFIFLLIHVLLFLGRKPAIRIAFAGLIAIPFLAILFWIIAQTVGAALLFSFYIPFYYELFMIRKSWETAVSHDSSNT